MDALSGVALEQACKGGDVPGRAARLEAFLVEHAADGPDGMTVGLELEGACDGVLLVCVGHEEVVVLVGLKAHVSGER